MPQSTTPPMLHASEEHAYPLHEYHLRLAGRQWVILHTGVILTYADEVQFFRDLRDHLASLVPSAEFPVVSFPFFYLTGQVFCPVFLLYSPIRVLCLFFNPGFNDLLTVRFVY